jgi:metal-dependent amidase/aminoacylase/carboxypeptidase family protein
MKFLYVPFLLLSLNLISYTSLSKVRGAINKNHETHLKPLFVHFHKNPELSMGEVATAKRIAQELKTIGFEVHEAIRQTGIVAILKKWRWTNGNDATI